MTRTTPIALAIGSMLALVAAPAAFAGQQTITNPAGPLTKIYLNDRLGCQVDQAGEPSSEFYGGTNPGACGTFIASPAGGGATIYGPNVPAGNPTTAFTPVSQTAVKGSGTGDDPYVVTTVADVGATGLRITQVDSYIVGEQSYATQIRVQNRGASSKAAILYHAGDCKLEGSDAGYGAYDAGTGGVFCSVSAGNSPRGRALGFIPRSTGSHYVEAEYGSVWDGIDGSNFPDTCDCGTLQDNGAGLSWPITVPAGQGLTRSLTTFSADMTPPETTVSSGPSGLTNDPTPTFTFSSSESSSSFECKIGSEAYAACSSPHTAIHLTDGSYTFSVRAIDRAGNVDPTPATRAFTVQTAAVSVSGSTLLVTAAPTAKDDLQITRPSVSTLRVTDTPGAVYTGSGIHAGAGCTTSGDFSANCSRAGITQVTVDSADQVDRIVNATGVDSSLNGGAASDVLIGGSANDTLTGAAGSDMLYGMNGDDQLFARDSASDQTINCDGGSTPGSADKADLDLLPKDPDSAVIGCETKTRH